MSEGQKTLTKVDIRYVPDDRLDTVMPKAMQGKDEGFLKPADLVSKDEPVFEHTLRSAVHPRSLETIYRIYQVIDGTDDERCAQLELRSMTWGDAIVIDGKAYYVAADGFVTRDDSGAIVPVSA